MPKDRKVERDVMRKAKKKKESCKEVCNQYLDNLTPDAEIPLETLTKMPSFVLNARCERDMDEDELFAHKECEDKEFGRKFEEKTAGLMKKRAAMRETLKSPTFALAGLENSDLVRPETRYWYGRAPSATFDPKGGTLDPSDSNEDDEDDSEEDDSDEDVIAVLAECKASPYPMLEKWCDRYRRESKSVEIVSVGRGGDRGKAEAIALTKSFSTSISFVTVRELFDEMRSSSNGNFESKISAGDFERKLDGALAMRYEKVRIHTEIHFDEPKAVAFSDRRKNGRLCGKTIGCLEYVKRSTANLFAGRASSIVREDRTTPNTTDKYAVNLYVFYSRLPSTGDFYRAHSDDDPTGRFKSVRSSESRSPEDGFVNFEIAFAVIRDDASVVIETHKK